MKALFLFSMSAATFRGRPRDEQTLAEKLGNVTFGSKVCKNLGLFGISIRV